MILRRAALVLACLLPCAATGYDLLSAPPASGFSMNLNLGTAPVSTTGYGVTTWNALAATALDTWNQIGIGPNEDRQFFSVRTPAVTGNPCARDGVNEVRFASDLCGLGFNGALAVTYAWIVDGKRVEEDVIFDSSRNWDAYPGALNFSRPDFMRVAIHEFGHAIGLDHPDEVAQSVTALMNSHISNVDSPTADDIVGAHAVEWPISIADIRPAIDSFAVQTGIAPGTINVISNAVTVANHNPEVAITITGGDYSIDGGPFTGASSTISNGRSVRLKVNASGANLTATTAVLMIGNVRSEFSVITAAGVSPTVINTLPYEPLAAGSSWSYTKNGLPYTRSIQTTSYAFNGIQTVRTQNTDGNNSYLTVDAAGIRQHGGHSGEGEYDFTLVPPITFSPHLATLGVVAPLSGTLALVGDWLPPGSALSYTGSSAVEGFETITVPAGTFNTIRTYTALSISGTISGEFTSSVQWSTTWSAPHVGTVKEISVVDGVPETYLLTAYNLPPDTAPEPISFAARSNVAAGAWIESDAALILGITAPAPLSVQGGEYSIDAGPYTSAPGTANIGQSVRLRVMSPTHSSASRSASAVLSIGSGSAVFSVTTAAVPPLAGLSVSGPAVLASGAAADYTATATWEDGFSELVAASWESSLPAIASVSAAGTVSVGAVASNTSVMLTATYSHGGVAKVVQFTIMLSAMPSASFAVGSGFTLLGNSAAVALDVPTLVGGPFNIVPGITSRTVSLWKWVGPSLRWAFYSPSLTSEQNSAYAIANEFDVLTEIQPGEGFWINASAPLTLAVPGGAPFVFGYTQFSPLHRGWNLIAIDQPLTPTEFNNTVAQPAPVSGPPEAANFASLWAWDAAARNWYFYSPQLELQGGLPAVKAYADGAGLRHFQDFGRTLSPGTGFWVRKQ